MRNVRVIRRSITCTRMVMDIRAYEFLFLFLLYIYMPAARAKNVLQATEEHDFVASFVNNYDFSAHARDTHEYHPFILAKTRESFSELERCLAQNGFEPVGRILICGYQEDAVPSYYTAGDAAIIDDEVSKKTNVGWQFATGNLFGFATGFLLQDCAGTNKTCIEHIASERIGLFDDRATLFHRHAFGAAYDGLVSMRRQLQKALLKNDTQQVLACLSSVWKWLYVHEIKDSEGHLIATQDILFSIEYVHYLLESSIPITHWFVGPDITYPIEVLPCQKQQATAAAQACMRRCVDCFKPINGQKTAYVFCSFVDGVGKSTLLGNIQNWLLYGDNLARYTRVDNSSTQRAKLFSLSSNVVIADLPAQASHVIPKPDGFVYVDVHTIKKFDESKKTALTEYIQEHKCELIAQFNTLITRIEQEKKAGILVLSETDSPEVAYAKNVVLLELEQIPWVPVHYQKEDYLFNAADFSGLRMLVPFDVVHSYGLKVVEPEQMLFSKGIALPLPYTAFLQDLIGQLRDSAVKKVVFVDFLSMYPRTSRENIRVNFLLQQLKYLFGSTFNQEASLYKGFVHSAELYPLLKWCGPQVEQALVQETGVRWALFLLLEQCKAQGISVVSCAALAQQLPSMFKNMYEQQQDQIHGVVQQKIVRELESVVQRYAGERDFEVLVRFDVASLCAFSLFLQELFTHAVHSDYYSSLWQGLDGALAQKETGGSSHVLYTAPGEVCHTSQAGVLENGLPVQVCYVFHASCRDKMVLTPFFSQVRAQWYALLAQILDWQMADDGLWCAEKGSELVLPCVVKQVADGMACYVRPLAHEVVTEAKGVPPRLFLGDYDKNDTVHWACRGDDWYCIDWGMAKTDCVVYAFGYNAARTRQDFITRLVRQYQTAQVQFGSGQYVVPASVVCACLDQAQAWDMALKELIRVTQGQKKSRTCHPHAARLFVRAIATLEMILKDYNVPVLVRKGDRADFSAALQLLERITLPAYFDISFEKPLFDDYAAVEPVIPWEYLEN